MQKRVRPAWPSLPFPHTGKNNYVFMLGHYISISELSCIRLLAFKSTDQLPLEHEKTCISPSLHVSLAFPLLCIVRYSYLQCNCSRWSAFLSKMAYCQIQVTSKHTTTLSLFQRHSHNISQMQSAFYVLTVGVVLSMICFTGEVVSVHQSCSACHGGTT